MFVFAQDDARQEEDSEHEIELSCALYLLSFLLLVQKYVSFIYFAVV